MGIVDLPIPETRDELNLHRVGSWDEEEHNKASSLKNKGFEQCTSSFCPYAVSFGSFVFGVRQNSDEENHWVTWKTSFAPYKVCRVCSNQDGSIIVCSTDAGTVALLRGLDGSVLATRKVSLEEDETAIVTAAHISFIARSKSNDAVVIGIPRGCDEIADFLLVLNIDSKSLNQKNPLKVADAARKMSIRSPLKIQQGDSDFVAFCGCFLDETRIRLLTLSKREDIAVCDYDSSNEVVTSVNASLEWKSDDDEEYSIDLTTGLRLHESNSDRSYVMFSAFRGDATTIHFLDPIRLSMAGFYEIKAVPTDKKQRTKILSIEPLDCPLPESSLAFAVAFKPHQNFGGAMIHVIQAQLNQESVESFHRVFAVPINESVVSMSLATSKCTYDRYYSFRYKIWQGSGNCQCRAFAAGDHYKEDSSAIGKIRLLIKSERFDEADNLVNTIGEKNLIADQFADFHPSEVALGRLQQILRRGTISEKSLMGQARQCFHRLSSGCISGNERAGLNLLEAAESIALWASPESSSNPPTLMEVTTALSTVVKALEEVLKILPAQRHQQFEEKRKQLEDQLCTLKYLSKKLPKDPEEKLRFARRFQGCRNPGHLFSSLVAERCFSAAEEIWKSHLRKDIKLEIAVESIVTNIGAAVNPIEYVSLLEDLVLPSLAINYDLLPSLWVWSCKLADELDDDDKLDQAVCLLRSMERATNELQLRVHSSFASYSPFVNRPVSRKHKSLGASRNSSNGDLSFSSCSSVPSSPQKENAMRGGFGSSIAFPTVLELGHIARGALKSQPTSSTLKTIKRVSGDDTDETKESRVREKLFNAKCLEAARRLGLDRRGAGLRSFSGFGGMENFIKELVRSMSTGVSTHDERRIIFTEKLKPFCDAFDIGFDESLVKYLKDLCGGTNASVSAIQESASVARCCENITMKCQGILVVLRAALFCRYSSPWLTDLSRDAIEWSSRDLGLRSELIEAARLLLIDSIVRKYCGNEGCDLFRVDNPRHAIRLLEFVTQHYRHGSVLDDVLNLADAFNHLSRLDACAAVCCRAIDGGGVDLCSDLIERLYERDALLADSTCDRVVSFCIELVSECSKPSISCLPENRMGKLKENALNGSSAAGSILSIALARSRTESPSLNHYSKVDFVLLESLKSDFLRVNELQRNHSVFLGFSELRCTDKLLKVAASLIEKVVPAYVSRDWKAWNVKLSFARRACTLLAISCNCQETEFWCAAVSMVTNPLKWNFDDSLCIDFLSDVGVLGGYCISNAISSRVVLSIAFCLCLKASNQARSSPTDFNENFGRALSLLHDYVLASCPENLLSQSQSLSSLAETVWHVLLRGDGGVGEALEEFRVKLLTKAWSSRNQLNLSPNATTEEEKKNVLGPAPCLHAIWYVGDGLLLPPPESIDRSVKFCKEMMRTLTVSTRQQFVTTGISEIINFLVHRGALSVALRLLSSSSALLLSSCVPDSAYTPLTGTIQDILTASVERSLGGSCNGITSKIVDSQHAVSFLLSLPLKKAFKVYRSAHATAISTRDFPRVIALANVGRVCGCPELSATNKICTGWKNQDKLVAQCRRLAQQAVWWKFLRIHSISFEPKRFEDGNRIDNGPSYAHSLIATIVARLHSILQKERGSPVSKILDLLARYADTFGLKREETVKEYIQYLLSFPGESKEDSRINLAQVDGWARTLIPLIRPNLKQALLLRACVLKMEGDERAFKDYERYEIVLSLYLESLHRIRAHENASKLEQQILNAELEAIGRRCDALAILSSVFAGKRKSDRPDFPKFFPPLPPDVTQYSKDIPTIPSCGILGMSGSTFDPLAPLEDVLLRGYDGNTTTALAPLCLPLGLPSGYIHARFLMEHFRWAQRKMSTMPSFDHDVLPVFGKIHSSGDKAALAEWCAGYFDSNDTDKLNCLELALTCAIKYSSEAEQRGNRYSRPERDHNTAEPEMKALEAVQRLAKAKSALSDKIAVVTALKRAPQVASIVEQLLDRLDQTLWKNDGQDWPLSESPELLIEVLLTEASLLAANLSVGSEPLPIQQFRQLSSLVNDACQALSEEHSHIHVTHIAKSLVRGWLFQGDMLSSGTDMPVEQRSGSCLVRKPSKLVVHSEFKEDEPTIDFVMDLSTIQDDGQFWCEDTRKQEESNVTLDEERSALKKSEREESEDMTVRVALRVAFVLSASIGESAAATDDKNSGGSSVAATVVRSVGKNKAGGLLARIEKVGSKQNSYIMEIARDLLRVVFARPELQRESNFLLEPEQKLGKTVTFSMRHRSLRSAAVLVPQEALEKVIAEEDYFGGSSDVTLNQCSFGAFVAHECEKIGMPLTNSDLGHISSMHFSSFARTLWRHHRESHVNVTFSRGRLLLLLLEMSLRDETEIDAAFVELILKEMARLHLSRSLLLACEDLVALKTAVGVEKYESLLKNCNGAVNAAIFTSAKSILSELQAWARAGLSEQPETNMVEAGKTLWRLGRVVKVFTSSPDGQNQLRQFILALMDTAMKVQESEDLEKVINEVLFNSLRHITDQGWRDELFEKARMIPKQVAP